MSTGITKISMNVPEMKIINHEIYLGIRDVKMRRGKMHFRTDEIQE